MCVRLFISYTRSERNRPIDRERERVSWIIETQRKSRNREMVMLLYPHPKDTWERSFNHTNSINRQSNGKATHKRKCLSTLYRNQTAAQVHFNPMTTHPTHPFHFIQFNPILFHSIPYQTKNPLKRQLKMGFSYYERIQNANENRLSTGGMQSENSKIKRLCCYAILLRLTFILGKWQLDLLNKIENYDDGWWRVKNSM